MQQDADAKTAGAECRRLHGGRPEFAFQTISKNSKKTEIRQHCLLMLCFCSGGEMQECAYPRAPKPIARGDRMPRVKSVRPASASPNPAICLAVFCMPPAICGIRMAMRRSSNAEDRIIIPQESLSQMIPASRDLGPQDAGDKSER